MRRLSCDLCSASVVQITCCFSGNNGPFPGLSKGMTLTFLQTMGKQSMLTGRQQSFGCQASQLCCTGWWAERPKSSDSPPVGVVSGPILMECYGGMAGELVCLFQPKAVRKKATSGGEAGSDTGFTKGGKTF